MTDMKLLKKQQHGIWELQEQVEYLTDKQEGTVNKMICVFCAWALRAEEAVKIIMIGGKRYPCCAYHYILYGGLSDENI